MFETKSIGGPFATQFDKAFQRVEVSRVSVDQREPEATYEPNHPDADAAGFVKRPRVNVVEELTNMMSASRSYDANLLILRRVRTMAQAAMQIGQG